MIEDCKSAKNPKAYRIKHQAEYQLHDSLKKELQDLGVTKIPSSNKIQKRIENLESEQAAIVREKQELLKNAIADTASKLDTLEAAQKANEFADIFARNMGIPLKIEPEPQGVDKYLSMATKIANYIEEHPKVVEYGVPALTFVAGLFTGKKVEQVNDNMYGQRSAPSQPQEEIDFDKIPD